MKKLFVLLIVLLGCSKEIKKLIYKNKIGNEFWNYIIEGKVKELKDYIEENKININKEMNEEGEIALTLAAKLNKLNVVKLLLGLEDVNTNSKNQLGKTALIASILDAPKSFIRYQVIDELLNKGSDVNSRYGIKNNNSLMLAITLGDVHIVKKILNKNIEINAQNIFDETALILATKTDIDKEKKDEIIKILIENESIDFNIQDQHGKTAIMHLVINNLNSELFLILSRGLSKVDVNIQDYKFKTALIYAIESKNEIATSLLLQDGKIDLSIKDLEDKSIFCYFFENFEEDSLKFFQNNSKLKGTLIDRAFQFIDKLEKNLLEHCYESFIYFYQTDKNFANSLIEYLLKLSINQDSYKLIDSFIEFIHYLLDEDENFYKENFEQFFKLMIWNFLNEAFKNVKNESLIFFFNKFAGFKNKKIFLNLHKLNEEDRTILTVLATKGYEKIIEIILDFLNENGDSLEILRFLEMKDENQKKALDYIKNDSLISKYKKIEENIESSLKTLEEKAQYFLYKGDIDNYKKCLSKLDEVDKDFKPTLHFIKLIKEDCDDIALKILNDKDLKIDFNRKNSQESDYTVLDYILVFAKEKIFYKIIDNHNIFNSKNTETLLISLVESEGYSRENKLKILGKLLEAKEVKDNINITNSEGHSAFSLACMKGDYEIVSKLIDLEKLNLNIHINNKHLIEHILEDLRNLSNLKKYMPINDPQYLKIIKIFAKKDINFRKYLINNIFDEDDYLGRNIYKFLEKSNYEFEDNDFKLKKIDMFENKIQQFLSDKNLNLLQKVLISNPKEDVNIFLNCLLKFPKILEELIKLDSDVDLNFHEGDGHTLLFNSISNNHLKSLKLLVKQEKIDVNIVIDDNYTPLMLALLEKKFEEAKIILGNENIKLYLKDKDNRTAFDIALKLDNQEIATKILDKDVKNLFLTLSLDSFSSLDLSQKRILTPSIENRGNLIYYESLVNAAKIGNEKIISSFIKKIPFIPFCKMDKNKYVKGIALSAIEKNNLEILKIVLPYSKNILKELIMESFEYDIKEISELLISETANSNYNCFLSIFLEILVISSQKGYLEITEKLIEVKIKAGRKDELILISLMIASKYGHLNLVEKLIEKVSNVDNKYIEIYKYLRVDLGLKNYFSEYNNFLKALEKWADFNERIILYYTPLMLASEYGHLDVVKLLIEKNAKVDGVYDEEDEERNSPLILASMNGYLNVVGKLIEAGANVNYINNRYHTPLMLASKYGHLDVVKLLIEKNASVNIRNDFLITSDTALSLSLEEGYQNIVRLLIEKGADIKLKKPFTLSPIVMAAQKNYVEVVEIILEIIDETEKLEQFLLAFFTSAEYGNIELLKLLLKIPKEEGKKQVLIERNLKGDTSLILASREGHLDVVKKLIEEGANVNEKNLNGDTSLILASREGHLDVVERLIEEKANINNDNNQGDTSLILASKEGHLDVVKKLIKEGVNVNEKNLSGDTSLILASKEGHLDVVKKLIKEGANVNEKNLNGDTSLILASREGHLDVVKKLIEEGANVNEKNLNGDTSLILASKYGHLDVVERLIEEKANINDDNNQGDTSLINACKNRNVELVRILIKKGVDVDHKNKKGETAEKIAFYNKDLKILTLLLKDENTAIKKLEIRELHDKIFGFTFCLILFLYWFYKG